MLPRLAVPGQPYRAEPGPTALSSGRSLLTWSAAAALGARLFSDDRGGGNTSFGGHRPSRPLGARPYPAPRVRDSWRPAGPHLRSGAAELRPAGGDPRQLRLCAPAVRSRRLHHISKSASRNVPVPGNGPRQWLALVTAPDAVVPTASGISTVIFVLARFREGAWAVLIAIHQLTVPAIVERPQPAVARGSRGQWTRSTTIKTATK